MSRTKEELLAASVQVKTETVKGANSADRIGGILYDISEHIGEGSGNPFPTPTGAGYLHFNGVNYQWDTPSGGGGATTLGGLNDVTISNPSEGQVLKYSGGQWINGSGGGSGSGIDWSDLVSHGKWWNQNLTKSGDNYLVKGPLAGEISYIEFSNGVRLGVDNEHASTLKVYNNGTAQANFYATGGVSALGYDASGGGGGGGSLTPGSLAEYFDGQTKNGTPNDGEILVYRPNNGGWKFEAKPSGGGGQGGGGTVTSVGLQMPTGFSVSGSPITDNGTFNVGFSSGYSLVDSEDRANWNGKLNETTYNDFINNTTWWGQKITNGVVQGDMEAGAAGGAIKGFHSLELNTHNTDSDHGGFIDFHYKGAEGPDGTIYPDYTARIIEDSLGILHIESMTQEETLQKAGLHVGQNFKDSFVQIGNVKLVYDGDSAIRVEKSDGTAAHFYATGGVSALGIQPEVTGLESFTISNLNSTQIKIADKSTIWNSSTEPNNLVIETDNPTIRFKVKTNTEAAHTEAAQIHASGVQSNRFYLDGTHYLAYEDGNLTFGDSSSRKKVVLQDI